MYPETQKNTLSHDVTLAKLATVTTGSEVELEPVEAEMAGAFVEDALNEAEARESTDIHGNDEERHG